MYNFTIEHAQNDGSALWALQCFLRSQCESVFGLKAHDKEIYQPKFNACDVSPDRDRPHILVFPEGAKAVLSNSARTYWPTTLYELAHETVHLLNPITGDASYLEEGMAVYFSVQMSQLHTEHAMSPTCPFYIRAQQLVQQLPYGVYESGRIIREQCGSFDAATSDSLLSLFPQLDREVADALCRECNFK